MTLESAKQAARLVKEIELASSDDELAARLGRAAMDGSSDAANKLCNLAIDALQRLKRELETRLHNLQ